MLAFSKDGRTVVIAINDTDKEKTVSVDGDSVTLVVTDKDNDLCEKSVSGKDIMLSAKSVNTIIF